MPCAHRNERGCPVDATTDWSTPSVERQTDLVERAKQDPQAFGELYELHYSTILNYLLRRTLDVTLSSRSGSLAGHGGLAVPRGGSR